MSEPQEYRIQPLQRIAKVYRFPAPTKEELEKLEHDRQDLADQDEAQRADREKRIRAMADRHIPEWDRQWGGRCPYSEDEARRKLGLAELNPPPWYKRIARFYDENWEYIFEGVGPAIIFLAVFSIMALIIVNLGRATGWWGGLW